MGPISTTTVCPLHDSPFHPGLQLLGLALYRRHPGNLRRVHVRRSRLGQQPSVQRLELVFGHRPSLSELLDCFDLLSLKLHVIPSLEDIWGLRLSGGGIRNDRVLLFNHQPVLHILAGLSTGKGEQGVSVGRELGTRHRCLLLLLLLCRRQRGLLLLLLRQPFEQFSLSSAGLKLPPELLLLQDLFSQPLLLFYLQAVEPGFFVFIWKLRNSREGGREIVRRGKQLLSGFVSKRQLLVRQRGEKDRMTAGSPRSALKRTEMWCYQWRIVGC